ncbi:hypothetical protein XENOCAPTIV_003609 [Xenoophorus captivus]|uniref:Uncharacterized protein n=1 Tax=Xenoophorus captivus TaxID=1517983 RepID=A0ABV0RNL6_9TELE
MLPFVTLLPVHLHSTLRDNRGYFYSIQESHVAARSTCINLTAEILMPQANDEELHAFCNDSNVADKVAHLHSNKFFFFVAFFPIRPQFSLKQEMRAISLKINDLKKFKLI